MEIEDNYTSIGLSLDIAFRIYNKSLLYFGPGIDFGLSGKDNKRNFYCFGIGVSLK
jgi:hypothetical protein